jgi:hypothetical protein
VNSIVVENARAGTADWLLQRPAVGREIEGYAGATSVERGESIELFVHTDAAQWVLEVFRIGWYAGLGARRVAGPLPQRGTRQTMPTMDIQTGLVDCAWRDPVRLQTADATDGSPWPSGVYLARLTEGVRGTQSFVVFVVRDDARPSDLLVQLGVTTYQAYNAWGGKSLYHWGSSQGQRASKVCFNRPYAANAANPQAAYGMGAGEFLTNLQPCDDSYPISNAAWDINTVRWLEREGFDVAYSTDLDTHRRAPSPQHCKAWLSIGHDEYWTCAMRDHVEAARDAGVHLAFLGANAAYWQVRLEPSTASGTRDRIMVCHKKAKVDPCFAQSPMLATDKWRSAAVNRPEEQLLGVMYAGDPVDGDIVVVAAEHWIFGGTGLSSGDTVPGLLGYEVDCIQGQGPAEVTVLAASPWSTLVEPRTRGVAHMTLHRAPSGALVFASGTIQWAWGLDDFNAPSLRTSRSSPAARRITSNVLHRMTKPC